MAASFIYRPIHRKHRGLWPSNVPKSQHKSAPTSPPLLPSISPAISVTVPSTKLIGAKDNLRGALQTGHMGWDTNQAPMQAAWKQCLHLISLTAVPLSSSTLKQTAQSIPAVEPEMGRNDSSEGSTLKHTPECIAAVGLARKIQVLPATVRQ